MIKPVPTVNSWSARILDKKLTPLLVKGLSEKEQILNHLKRVRSVKGELQILVDLAEFSAEECMESIVADVSLEGLCPCDEWVCVPVPVHQPKSRAQYEIASKLWPCSFHEDKDLERLLAATWFSTNTVEEKFEFMRMSAALSLAGRDFQWRCGINSAEVIYRLRDQFNGAVLPLASACSGANGIVIVDSGSSRILAAACVGKSEHPLRHSVMEALDLIAQDQVDSAVDSASYLCNGCDVYLTHEPCIMCCMALLHARAKCVFFVEKCSYGGLVSAVRLHTLPSINHRYQVFRGLAP